MRRLIDADDEGIWKLLRQLTRGYADATSSVDDQRAAVRLPSGDGLFEGLKARRRQRS
jgi:hypothetical protein